MKKIFYIAVLVCLGSVKVFSQNDSTKVLAKNDSVVYNSDFSLLEGVYLSYTDFRKNRPVPKESIQSKDDKTQLDFIGKTLVENKEITVLYNGTENKLESTKIWGYSQNNTLYLNYEGKFYRVPVFGNISHFIGTIEVSYYSNSGMYGGMYGGGYPMYGGGRTVKQRETRQFIFDFYSGEIMDYSLSNVELLVSRDIKLYEEFMQYKKSKRKDIMMLYVRKFNIAHPVFFPISK